MKKTKVKKHLRRTKKGQVQVREHRRKVYKKWRKLVNMTPNELERFRQTEEGKKAGLTKTKAKSLGIKSGQESAEWILRMKPKARTFESAEKNWSDKEWEWAKRQNSFNARMIGNKGPLYDEKGRKTRKHTSLLIWGHDPKKNRGASNISKITDKKVERARKTVINEAEALKEATDFFRDIGYPPTESQYNNMIKALKDANLMRKPALTKKAINEDIKELKAIRKLEVRLPHLIDEEKRLSKRVDTLSKGRGFIKENVKKELLGENPEKPYGKKSTDAFKELFKNQGSMMTDQQLSNNIGYFYGKYGGGFKFK